MCMHRKAKQMTRILVDRRNGDNDIVINNWHWHTIVEEIRRLNVIDVDVAEKLHIQACGFGLTEMEAAVVADTLEQRSLPKLAATDRMLLDGSTTATPDDYKFHKVDTEKNYSTNAEVIRMFIDFCRCSKGFDVR